jgi:hypothetical protein
VVELLVGDHRQAPLSMPCPGDCGQTQQVPQPTSSHEIPRVLTEVVSHDDDAGG